MIRSRPRPEARRPPGAAALAALLAVSTPLLVRAQTPAPQAMDKGILSGFGPPTTAPPLKKPYFLGWSAQVGLPADLLKLPHEPGGVGADPVTGWVYVGRRDGRLVCLDRGRTVWETDIGGVILAPPTVFRNVVVAGTAEGVVHILNKVTGHRLARAILGEELITSPLVVEDAAGHTRAYVGTSAESLFAIDVDLGLKLWRAHRDAPSGFTIYGFARPIVTSDAVYAGFADGTVEALDPATGITRWEKHISPPGDLLDVDGLAWNGVSLFAASYSGGIFALDPATGDVRWQAKLRQMDRVLTDGLSVYAGGPGLWVGLNASDGTVKWRYTFGDGRACSAGALDRGLLMFAQDDGPILFVNDETGQGIGALETGEGFGTPPTLIGDVMYAESNYGRVYSAIIAP